MKRPLGRFAARLAVLLTVCAASLEASAETPPNPAPPALARSDAALAPAVPAPPISAPPPAISETVKPSDDQAALLAQLDAELEQSSPMSTGSMPSLSLYGFADASLARTFVPKGNTLATVVYPHTAFSVGNLNLYLASELGSNWRSLIEVRFTYLPNGARRIVGSDVVRTDTTLYDYTSLTRPLQPGSIQLQRATVEYAPDPALIFRVGNWLTPYGIWNEDHGTPTIIPVARPYVIGLELLPERQTGLLVLGTTYASDSLTLGYALGLANGRGPVQDYANLGENKALTLRLHGMHRAQGVFTFGAAAYYGRYTDTSQTIELDGDEPRVRERLVEQFDQLSVGLDARYVLGGFHVQSEVIWSDLKYTAAGRPLRLGAELRPDNRRYGGYVVVGYRFPWLGAMPYATAEYFSLINQFEPFRPSTNDIITAYGIGINSRPTTNVTIKLEGTLGIFYVDDPAGSAFADPIPGLQAQVAWAF